MIGTSDATSCQVYTSTPSPHPCVWAVDLDMMNSCPTAPVPPLEIFALDSSIKRLTGQGQEEGYLTVPRPADQGHHHYSQVARFSIRAFLLVITVNSQGSTSYALVGPLEGPFSPILFDAIRWARCRSRGSACKRHRTST